MVLLNLRHYYAFMQFLSPSTGKQSSNNPQNVAAGGGRARALYAFMSDCDEELSLQVQWRLFFPPVSHYTVEMCPIHCRSTTLSPPLPGWGCYNRFGVRWWRMVPGWLKRKTGPGTKKLCASTGIMPVWFSVRTGWPQTEVRSEDRFSTMDIWSELLNLISSQCTSFQQFRLLIN